MTAIENEIYGIVARRAFPSARMEEKTNDAFGRGMLDNEDNTCERCLLVGRKDLYRHPSVG